ncbi:DNA polymerase III subunit delta' [Gynuella sp.]|uniref:DNA polymerase III subunit delta' n=1 Tax=Gynuella sp. TaxID=2969146 RepID=UPI003D10A6B7
MTFPIWFEPVYRAQLQRFTQQKLPHAILLSGGRESGAEILADRLAERILCQRDNQFSCGQCKACLLVGAGSHPDYLSVRVDGGASQIKVDRIRALIEFSQATAQVGHYKVIVIHECHKMNLASANALLKVLEEPPSNTFLILQTDSAEMLLPTIRSRCSVVPVPVASKEQAAEWLRYSSFADDRVELLLEICSHNPFRVLRLQQLDAFTVRDTMVNGFNQLAKGVVSPVELARSWSKFNGEVLYGWLNLWVVQLSCFVGSGGHRPISDPDMAKFLKYTAKKAHAPSIFAFADYILECVSVFRSQQNLNLQLMVENTLIRWHDLLTA